MILLIKGSKCKRISACCFQRNPSVFRGYEISVVTRFRIVLFKDLAQRIDHNKIEKHSEVADDADLSGNGVDSLIGWFRS